MRRMSSQRSERTSARYSIFANGYANRVRNIKRRRITDSLIIKTRKASEYLVLRVLFWEIEPTRRKRAAQRTFRINVFIRDGIEEARGSEQAVFRVVAIESNDALEVLSSRTRSMLWYFRNMRKRNLTRLGVMKKVDRVVLKVYGSFKVRLRSPRWIPAFSSMVESASDFDIQIPIAAIDLALTARRKKWCVIL